MPTITDKHGNAQVIRSVRISVDKNPRAIGSSAKRTERYVLLKSNHHAEVWVETTKGGRRLGKLVIVPYFEVRGHRRKSDEHGRLFCFSLAPGEFVQIEEAGKPVLYRVNGSSENRVLLVQHDDGRKKDERDRTGDNLRVGATELIAPTTNKVTVTYLGEVKPCGG